MFDVNEDVVSDWGYREHVCPVCKEKFKSVFPIFKPRNKIMKYATAVLETYAEQQMVCDKCILKNEFKKDENLS